MRTAPDKSLGYIICPFVIPPNADAEAWLSNSSPEEGWQELGQILLALRAHDQRIEENLAELLQLYLPRVPEKVHTFIGIAKGENKRIQYWIHEGAPGDAQEAVEQVLKGASPRASSFILLPKSMENELPEPKVLGGAEEQEVPYQTDAPTAVLTGKLNDDGSLDLRTDTVARDKPNADGKPGTINIRRTKAKAKAMINKGEGNPLPSLEEKKRKRAKDDQRAVERQLRLLKEMQEFGEAIRMNLLEKSGLSDDRVLRDLNILEESVREAAHHLNSDELRPALDRHFGLDNLRESDLDKQADGCTIAALLMMNAAMLHQRIANGRWLSGVSDLAVVKNDVNVVRRISREWDRVMRHDFRPVLEPAVEAIQAIEDTGKLAGLERALRHIAAEAERIAETYADMGADHAGPLFNRVMGNQASDGAFFTRPVAASIAARLTLDACGDVDWTDPAVWKEHKTVDLACGSGTLLAAMLTDMKRRAKEQGATEPLVTALQKLAVEETIKGLDINPVSLQLAASQLTAGNHNISYRQMGLHLMPYGPRRDLPGQVAVGTLELLGQKAIVARRGELGLADDKIVSQSVWPQDDDAELEDAVDAVKKARIVIMNPPFTRRAKMGEKFPQAIKINLQRRVDAMEAKLTNTDKEMADFTDKNALRPLFTALADRCANLEHGIVSMIAPLAALCGTSGIHERKILAQRFHIHTVLTCHQPGQTNMSQNTNINESIIIAKRHRGTRPPTRFINLDRMPTDPDDIEDLHQRLLECPIGQLANGWGEVSHWPADLMEQGDWSSAIWRSSELAEASAYYARHQDLISMKQSGISPRRTSDEILRSCKPAEGVLSGSFPVLQTAGQDGQYRIESQPEGSWITKNPDDKRRRANGGTYPESDKILAKGGYLLVPFRQDNSSARLTAVASDNKLVGTGWMPASKPTPAEAKAIAVFMNSTVGRIQLMRNTGMKLTYPTYPPAAYANIHIPDMKDARIRQVLVGCWERTRDMEVPQFRDGESEVRRLWDEAVAEAMGWDPKELARLRNLLHNEPHVRGLGYNQYADEIEDIEDMEAYPDGEIAEDEG